MIRRFSIYFFLMGFMAGWIYPPGLSSQTSKGSLDFLVETLSQEFTQTGKLQNILVGFVDFNELSTSAKKKISSAGYTPGDMVPARCILSGKSNKGDIYISKTKDQTTKSQDWIGIGSFRVMLYDSLEKWENRKKD